MNDSPPRRLFTAYCLVVGSLVLCFSWLNREYQLDDALIYFRYVRNAIEGRGLTYNPGERFNALTSPLHTLLLLALASLTRDVQLASMLHGTLFMLLAVLVWMTLVARHASVHAALPAGLLFASAVIFYDTYGLETTQFLFLLGLCIWLFETERVAALGVALALLILTRGEGALLVPALAVEHFRLKRPFPPLRHFLVPALILGAFLGFNRAYFGEFLPDTLAAKIGQGKSGLWGPWPAFLNAPWLPKYYIPRNDLWRLTLIVLIPLGALRLGLGSFNVILGIFLTLYAAFYILLGIPNYHWYDAPFFLAACLYAGIGMDQAIRMLRARLAGRRRQLLTAVAGLLFAFVIAVNLGHASRGIRSNPVQLHYRNIGLWIRFNTPPDAQIAAVEIGTLGFYSRRPMIDILGLITPNNARYLAEGRFDAWLEGSSPDYILAHKPIWSHERSIKSLVAMGRVREFKRFGGHILYQWVDRMESAIVVSGP